MIFLFIFYYKTKFEDNCHQTEINTPIFSKQIENFYSYLNKKQLFNAPNKTHWLIYPPNNWFGSYQLNTNFAPWCCFYNIPKFLKSELLILYNTGKTRRFIEPNQCENTQYQKITVQELIVKKTKGKKTKINN